MEKNIGKSEKNKYLLINNLCYNKINSNDRDFYIKQIKYAR